MHNVLKIALIVHREALTITLLVEGCTDFQNIVHFYSYTRDKVPHTGDFAYTRTPQIVLSPRRSPQNPLDRSLG